MYLGIDLGGTKIAAGLVDDNGRILKDRRILTHRSRPCREVIKDMILIGNTLIEDCAPESVIAAGIGAPGLVDTEKGVLINSVNLGWKNTPIASMLREGIGVPVYAGNDATLAGIAEMEAGVLRGVKCGVMLTLGTGVGSAVICEGRIQYGANNVASEIGHMIVGSNFYRCSCGRNGCLETFASATALIRYAKRLLKAGEPSVLGQMCPNGNIDSISGIMIFNAAQEGDAVAAKAVDRVARYLGIGISNVIAVLDPEKIVLGGGMSKAGDFLLDKVKNEVERIRFYKDIPSGEIVFARFGNEAGIIGAAMLARQRIEEE